VFLQPKHLSLVPANMVETLVDIGFCSKQIMVIEQKRGVQDSIERHKKASKCQEYRGNFFLPPHQQVSLVLKFLVSLERKLNARKSVGIRKENE